MVLISLFIQAGSDVALFSRWRRCYLTLLSPPEAVSQSSNQHIGLLVFCSLSPNNATAAGATECDVPQQQCSNQAPDCQHPGGPRCSKTTVDNSSNMTHFHKGDPHIQLTQHITRSMCLLKMAPFKSKIHRYYRFITKKHTQHNPNITKNPIIACMVSVYPVRQASLCSNSRSATANSCQIFLIKCWPQWGVWNFPGRDTGTWDSNGVQVFLAWYERQLWIHSNVSGSLGTCHSGLCSTFLLLWQSSRGSGGEILQKQEVCPCGEPILQRKNVHFVCVCQELGPGVTARLLLAQNRKTLEWGGATVDGE